MKKLCDWVDMTLTPDILGLVLAAAFVGILVMVIVNMGGRWKQRLGD
jgi:predicted outer membrane lipoprotein